MAGDLLQPRVVDAGGRERLGEAPRLVDAEVLQAVDPAAEGLGLELELVGLRPSLRQAVAWRLGRRDTVAMRPIRSTAVSRSGASATTWPIFSRRIWV